MTHVPTKYYYIENNKRDDETTQEQNPIPLSGGMG